MTTQTQTQPQAEKQPNKPNFGAANALGVLWGKAKDNLAKEELEWFSNLSTTVIMETINLEDTLSALGCTINSDDSSGAFEERNNVASLLFSLSNQIGIIKELVEISSDANYQLLHPQRFAKNLDDTGKQETRSRPESANWKEVKYWADNHLLAAGNRYRLIDNATKEVITEFDAESVNDAEYKAGLFLREAAKRGVAA